MPEEATACIFCGTNEDVKQVPVDAPWNYQPVCAGCLESFEKNCEPGEEVD